MTAKSSSFQQAAGCTQYILELCDTSGEHKPVARFQSAKPFMPVNTGDRFDDTGWERLEGVGAIASPEQPLRYTVHSVKHLILQDTGGLIVKYCVNLEPYTGPGSPIWSSIGLGAQ